MLKFEKKKIRQQKVNSCYCKARFNRVLGISVHAVCVLDLCGIRGTHSGTVEGTLLVGHGAMHFSTQVPNFSEKFAVFRFRVVFI